MAWWWGGAFVVLVLGVLGSVLYYGNAIIELVGSAPTAGVAGLLLFGASLVLWILRLCSRMHTTAYHRAEDSAERVTMLKAYLALRKEEKLGAEHIELVLTVIFRPGLTGLVKDETAPRWSLSSLLSKGA